MLDANPNLNVMKLYRGDSVPSQVLSAERKVRGKTFARHFCGTGLAAKFGNNGFHSLVRGKSIRQIVEEHIGYVTGHPSEKLYLHSPMLSFSASRDRAFRFLERSEKKSLRLVECDFEDATNFLWELDVELPAASEAGLYHIHYKSDPAHCVAIVERQLRKALETEAQDGNPHSLMSALENFIAMKHAAADKGQHHADLIDVVEFLRADRLGADPTVLANARKMAERDLEWLLYPADPMGDGTGPPNAHFLMNKHLSVSACYYVQS